MLVSYDPALIALSVLVAIQGGYVSLSLAGRLVRTPGLRRKTMLAAAAVALGGGIWAMHFVGMLALNLPIAVNYDVLLTLISLLTSILVTGLGLYIASYGALTRVRLASGGLLMGVGISIMHYVGMAAVRANCVIGYSAPLVAASVLVGVAASSLALWLAFTTRHRWHTFAAAVALGLAISGMHYTAMAAASFTPAEQVLALAAPAISQPLLAIVVAVATFLISGVFLLVVLPDRAATVQAEPGASMMDAPAAAGAEAGGEATRLDRLAVEKNRATLFLDLDEVVAIQAEQHYTRVFDGTDSYFCGQSVSELESRLDPKVFVRVHRSHIVNIHHARAFRRLKEQGVLLLDGPEGREVPVSRSNVPKLRAALGI